FAAADRVALLLFGGFRPAGGPAAEHCVRPQRAQRMTWDASLSERLPLLVDRVGFREGELRVYLRPVAETGPYYVLQLEDVASFFDSLPRGAEVRISDWPKHGSFGWWLPADDPHHSVKVAAIGAGSGFFMALARRVVYRLADESEAFNWPG